MFMLGIYTRLSRQDDASNSISNQKREGIAFAKKHKLSYEIYNEGERVSGGTEIALRPVLDQLMNDIAINKITHVWFRNQNRLERNSATFHLFANHAIKHNTKVYFDNRLEDWNDPNTLLMSSVVSAFNAYKLKLQSYQTKRTLLDNVKEGKSFGIYPYGYTTNDRGFLVIDSEEKEVVELIYKLSYEGMGTRSIAEFLNDKKIPTRYNKIGKGTMTVKNKYTDIETTKEKKDIKWSGNSVRGIIVNTIYKGERKWKGEIYEAPKIFDEDYWEKVNNNLTNNRNNTGKKVEHKYLLKGILECGLCGRNMYGRTRVNKKDHYYMCSSKRYKDLNCGNRSINIDFIEMYLWGLLFYRSEIKKSMVQSSTKDFDISIDDLNQRKTKHFAELKSVVSTP